MLVLTRTVNERIRIGDDIEIVVVGIKGDRVKIGVKAPRHLGVDRQEVYEQKHTPSPEAQLCLWGEE